MSLQSSFPADWDKVKEGVPIVVAGITFHLTYYMATQAQIVFQAEAKKLSNVMSLEDATAEAMRTTLINHIVLGWEDLQEEDGGEFLPYSKENLNRILHTYVGLDVMLMEAASDVIKFKSEVKKETMGKSEMP